MHLLHIFILSSTTSFSVNFIDSEDVTTYYNINSLCYFEAFEEKLNSKEYFDEFDLSNFAFTRNDFELMIKICKSEFKEEIEFIDLLLITFHARTLKCKKMCKFYDLINNIQYNPKNFYKILKIYLYVYKTFFSTKEDLVLEIYQNTYLKIYEKLIIHQKVSCIVELKSYYNLEFSKFWRVELLSNEGVSSIPLPMPSILNYCFNLNLTSNFEENKKMYYELEVLLLIYNLIILKRLNSNNNEYYIDSLIFKNIKNQPSFLYCFIKFIITIVDTSELFPKLNTIVFKNCNLDFLINQIETKFKHINILYIETCEDCGPFLTHLTNSEKLFSEVSTIHIHCCTFKNDKSNFLHLKKSIKTLKILSFNSYLPNFICKLEIFRHKSLFLNQLEFEINNQTKFKNLKFLSEFKNLKFLTISIFVDQIPTNLNLIENLNICFKHLNLKKLNLSFELGIFFSSQFDLSTMKSINTLIFKGAIIDNFKLNVQSNVSIILQSVYIYNNAFINLKNIKVVFYTLNFNLYNLWIFNRNTFLENQILVLEINFDFLKEFENVNLISLNQCQHLIIRNYSNKKIKLAEKLFKLFVFKTLKKVSFENSKETKKVFLMFNSSKLEVINFLNCQTLLILDYISEEYLKIILSSLKKIIISSKFGSLGSNLEIFKLKNINIKEIKIVEKKFINFIKGLLYDVFLFERDSENNIICPRI